ncbi:hypothetical protein LJB85_02145 [Porphyromonadaceae bacterium OttesenSCG-928-L07]|nr:hypothetical protein [Porphyromonadaceae bacterium OttesenSCG-928-L07]MDL2330803.1 hypothetical protein [Odoribacter sp. OttesenSCG-928-A06]
MKKNDILFILVLCVIFLPFILCEEALGAYMSFSKKHALILGFIQYALFSTMGEMLGLRFRSGKYNEKGFGIWTRALVWGTLGISIAVSIQVFAPGSAIFTDYLFNMDGKMMAAIAVPGFSGMKLLYAFITAILMDVLFSPLFMIVQKIFDMHIVQTGGTLKGFFTHKVKYSENLHNFNWKVLWGFVFCKTIPLFWIPAHTIVFMLPAEFQVLVSALLGIVLGIILYIANRR